MILNNDISAKIARVLQKSLRRRIKEWEYYTIWRRMDVRKTAYCHALWVCRIGMAENTHFLSTRNSILYVRRSCTRDTLFPTPTLYVCVLCACDRVRLGVKLDAWWKPKDLNSYTYIAHLPWDTRFVFDRKFSPVTPETSRWPFRRTPEDSLV